MKIRYQNTIVYHTQTKTESCINKIEVEHLALKNSLNSWSQERNKLIGCSKDTWTPQ